MNKNIAEMFISAIIIYIIVSCFIGNNKEHFYLWNLPTRWTRPIYDIRGYPPYSWYFIHNGKLYDNRYIDLRKYPELYYYLPYYNNGMIYMANGKYTYNMFAKQFNLPILYQIPYDNIDWIGLVNNGIIDPTYKP